MAAKSGKHRNESEQNEARLAEVERGIDSTQEPAADLPADVAAEIAEPPADVSALKLRNLWNSVKQREAAWLRARERAESEQKQAADERARLDAERAVLSEQQQAAAAQDADLVRREAELVKARLAAKEGFADEHRDALQSLVARHEELLTQNAELEATATTTGQKIIDEARAKAAEIADQIAEREASLDAREDELKVLANELGREKGFAKENEEAIAHRYAHQVEVKVAAIRDKLADANERLELEQQLRQSRERELKEARAVLARYGTEPDELKQRNDELLVRERELRDELSRRPTADVVENLRTQAQLAEDATAMAAHWRQQYAQVDRQLRYQLKNVGELEVLRDERDAMAAQRETLRQALDQHRREWEELQSKEGSSEPFPACSAYDRDPALQEPIDTRDPESLADLADEVRNRMATQSTTAFFYSESDVRIFLAGLAASRLHLLQGMSGTGKTSLPREFFHALSGETGVEIIEVQAGWRDKDDLFGYYNAFEKRFAEQSFTKALYRALLPSNVDRPMVIILDEMNLAHPEQYFGSMLSILENAITKQPYVDLLPNELPGLPAMFEGNRIPLPQNVWFVGTANHDETTVAFADKTYDRSHVQELPSRHVAFAARRQGLADPISLGQLNRHFSDAARIHASTVRKVQEFLDRDLHDKFAPFGVGWGNRLERQVDSFVPVVIASGGDVTEAVDHLVATKLIRKLEDRFGIKPDDLESLAVEIEVAWESFDDKRQPVKTAERLRREAKRLRGGY